MDRGCISCLRNEYCSESGRKQWQVLRIRIGNMNKAKNFLIGDMQLELASDVQGK